MSEKFLRAKEALVLYRGVGDSMGGHLYKGGVLDPALVDPDDADRLVRERFLEWVVRDGESFKLAEDTDTGKKGDPVTVGDAGIVPDGEVDNGTVNQPLHDAGREQAAADDTTGEEEQRRADARAKLSELGGTPDGRSSDAVMVEYLVGKGYDRAEAEKADRTQLKSLVASVK
jgi:hypothetical protein